MRARWRGSGATVLGALKCNARLYQLPSLSRMSVSSQPERATYYHTGYLMHVPCTIAYTAAPSGAKTMKRMPAAGSTLSTAPLSSAKMVMTSRFLLTLEYTATFPVAEQAASTMALPLGNASSRTGKPDVQSSTRTVASCVAATSSTLLAKAYGENVRVSSGAPSWVHT